MDLFRFSLISFFCFPVFASAQPVIEAVFDIPVIEGSVIDAARFEEFFPKKLLDINALKSKEENNALLAKIRNEILSGLEPDSIPPEDYQLPLPYFFSTHVVNHDYDGRLEQVTFSEDSLPIRSSRVLRLYRLLEAAIGTSDTVHVRGRARSQMPQEIIVSWKRPEGRIVMELDVDGLIHFGCSVRIDYYPQGSRRLEYLDRAVTTPIQLGNSPLETVEAYLEHHPAFQDGTGPFPPTLIADSLEGRLDQYGTTISLKDHMGFRTSQRLNELHLRLEPALEKEFSNFSPQERYQRILDLALQAASGGVQVGAAAFLAHYDDPATQPFLRRSLEVSLPSGVAHHSAKGLAKYCSGPLLQQTVEDFLLDEKGAEAILRHLPTRKQVGELWKIRDQIPDGKAQRRLDGILTLAERKLE